MPEQIARALAAGRIERIHRRVYALAPLPPRPVFVVTGDGVAPEYAAHVRAAVLSLGPGAVVQRRSAAALRGWALLVEPARTIELAVPHGSRRSAIAHVKVTERRGLPSEPVTAAGGGDPIQATTAVQTVLDCSRQLPLLEAVVICDSALRAGALTLAELGRAASSLPGKRDAARARQVLELCDPECGSVLESVLRVRMHLAGVIGFATQRVIRDGAGAYVLRVDFVFERERLVVEVDGDKWHQDPERDRRLDNYLTALGWRVLRYRWSEVVHAHTDVLAEIRLALRSSVTDDCQPTGLLAAPAA